MGTLCTGGTVFCLGYLLREREPNRLPRSWTKVLGGLRSQTGFISTLLADGHSRKGKSSFWQEGLNLCQVSVIVMITKLVENKRRKAHQYWPDANGEESKETVLEIGGGARVEILSTSYQGSYHRRQIWNQNHFINLISRNFTIFLPDGDMKQVVQIQTKEWPDLTAPKEPRGRQRTHF